MHNRAVVKIHGTPFVLPHPNSPGLWIDEGYVLGETEGERRQAAMDRLFREGNVECRKLLRFIAEWEAKMHGGPVLVEEHWYTHVGLKLHVADDPTLSPKHVPGCPKCEELKEFFDNR